MGNGKPEAPKGAPELGMFDQIKSDTAQPVPLSGGFEITDPAHAKTVGHELIHLADTIEEAVSDLISQAHITAHGFGKFEGLSDPLSKSVSDNVQASVQSLSSVSEFFRGIGKAIKDGISHQEGVNDEQAQLMRKQGDQLS